MWLWGGVCQGNDPYFFSYLGTGVLSRVHAQGMSIGGVHLWVGVGCKIPKKMLRGVAFIMTLLIEGGFIHFLVYPIPIQFTDEGVYGTVCTVYGAVYGIRHNIRGQRSKSRL